MDRLKYTDECLDILQKKTIYFAETWCNKVYCKQDTAGIKKIENKKLEQIRNTKILSVINKISSTKILPVIFHTLIPK